VYCYLRDPSAAVKRIKKKKFALQILTAFKSSINCLLKFLRLWVCGFFRGVEGWVCFVCLEFLFVCF